MSSSLSHSVEMENATSGIDFSEGICEACKSSFAEKNVIISGLKRDLASQATEVRKLEKENRQHKEHLARVLEEKSHLENSVQSLKNDLESGQILRDGTGKGTVHVSPESPEFSLLNLQEQLSRLENEKKNLNERIRVFESETEELSDIFDKQQEKFSQDISNKDRVIQVLGKERELMEKDSKNLRDDLEKTRRSNENTKKLVDQLKTSIQEKASAIVNLSDLHNEALNQINKQQRELVGAEERLKNELCCREILERQFEDEKEKTHSLIEENRQLKLQVGDLKKSDVEFRAAEIEMQEELGRLKGLVEVLEKGGMKNDTTIRKLEKDNAKVRLEKETTEKALTDVTKGSQDLQREFEMLRNEKDRIEDRKQELEKKMEILVEDLEGMCYVKASQERQIVCLRKHLEELEQKLETNAAEKARLEEEIQTMEGTIEELKIKEKQHNKILEATKDELETVTLRKENLEAVSEKLKDANKILKEKAGLLSKELENLQCVFTTKVKEMEDLEGVLNQKADIIVFLQNEKQKLQSEVEELLGNEASRGIELKNVRHECSRLRKDQAVADGNYKKVNSQLQECLELLDAKRNEHLAERSRLMEQLQKQMEEISNFREHNVEVKEELRNREDEAEALTMEKEELVRNLESSNNQIKERFEIQSRLEEEVKMLKERLNETEENAQKTLEKVAKTKRKHLELKRKLEITIDEKSDFEISLANALDSVKRWKEVCLEIKEERNRLQMQIEELDRNLNDKSMHFTEEKSNLEKDMESLRSVVRRMKSNEERLREKIEELRDEVDKLSEVKSKQESEIRKFVRENERMTRTLMDYDTIVQVNAKLKEQGEDMSRQNACMKRELDAFQGKARAAEDENERLKKEIQECQRLLEITETNSKGAMEECEDLRHRSIVLRDTNAEIEEEKQRLLNENCRLKEKKNNVIQERNKLQDMIESLDKCHTEKNEKLTKRNALLVKELEILRRTMKQNEDKERELVEEVQELNESLGKVIAEKDDIQCSYKKSDGENKRLRNRILELGKQVEQIEVERETKSRLEVQLLEKEQVIKKLKENVKVLSTLVSGMNQQQNQKANEVRGKDREISELRTNIESLRKDKAKFKDVIRRLDEELKKVRARERSCIEMLESEKDKNSLLVSAASRSEKKIDEYKELVETNEVRNKEKIHEFEEERQLVRDQLRKLESDYSQANQLIDELNKQVKERQEKICLLTADKIEMKMKIKKTEEEINELSCEIKALKMENQKLRDHGENLEKLFASKNSAMSDKKSGMSKEITVLRETVAQLRSAGETNRKEVSDLKRKVDMEKSQKKKVEIEVNEIRLIKERLEGQSDELLCNCTRLEELVKKGVEERAEGEKKLQGEKQRRSILEKELKETAQKLATQNNTLVDIQEEIASCQETIGKLRTSKDELFNSQNDVEERNERLLHEMQSMSDKCEQIGSEKEHLSDLASFYEKELENLKNEACETKTKLRMKIQEMENETAQLQNKLKTKEETLTKLTEKQQKLQDDLKHAKEEIDDMEDENEDLLAELERSKEVNKKAKDALCSLQAEHDDLQEEMKGKQQSWKESEENFTLKTFEMATEVESLKKRLAQAQERTEKQRELEKMLRTEIEELSDAYVKMEEEIHHCNKENQSLKQKVQELSQNVEELDLARETACLLKEKRHCELLKSEKNLQRLEKNMKEKQKANKGLMKELDLIMEKQKILEMQLSSEKEVSNQRIKQIQDLQNDQRKLDEELWRTRRNQEKLEAEIETWKVNSGSMKMRMEMLEDELKESTTDKENIVQLYEESKRRNSIYDEQVSRIETELMEQKESFAENIDQITKNRDDLQEEVTNLGEKLDRQKIQTTELHSSLVDMTTKYEGCRMVTSVLHNDIRKKDEAIEQLEGRKKQILNLLADLDSKIAEIQVQAVNLENENQNLTQEIARLIMSEEQCRKSLDDQANVFGDKLKAGSDEIQRLKELNQHFMQLHLNAEDKLQEANAELKRIRAEKERFVVENACLAESKRVLKNEVLERERTENKLEQSLSVEKNKTTKLETQVSDLLEECQSLKGKEVCRKENHEKTLHELKDEKKKNEDVTSRLEQKIKDLEETRQNLKSLQRKVKEQETVLSNTIVKHEIALQSKEETVESLTHKNSKLEEVIASLTSKVEDCQEENKTLEKGNKQLETNVEEKQQLLYDLKVAYENEVNLKNSLELEQKNLSVKLKKLSKDLAKLEFEHHRSLDANEELRAEIKKRQEEWSDQRSSLLKEKQTCEGELNCERIKLIDADLQKNVLCEKHEEVKKRLEEITKCLHDSRQRLEIQQGENERLKNELQKTSLERNYLEAVNEKVTKTLQKLKDEPAVSIEQEKLGTQTICKKGTNGPDDHLEKQHAQSPISYETRTSLTLLHAKKDSELESLLSEVVTGMRSLRNRTDTREEEICRLKKFVDSLQSEKDNLELECVKLVKRLENERKLRETTNENLMKMKEDMEGIEKEKAIVTRDMKVIHLNLSKENAEMREEIEFQRTNNARMKRKQIELKEEIDNLQEKIMIQKEKIQAKDFAVASSAKEVVCLRESNKNLEELNEEKTEVIKRQEETKEKHFVEIKSFQDLWEENLEQLGKLESRFHIYGDEKDQGMVKDALRPEEEGTNVSGLTTSSSAGDLKSRFDKLHEKSSLQFKRTEKLQEELTNAQRQWTMCLEKVNEANASTNALKNECQRLQKRLSKAEVDYEEAQLRIDELTSSLDVSTESLAKSNAAHEAESQRISEELNQMQIELLSACEKFKKCNLRVQSQEEIIRAKDSCIADLKGDLRLSCEKERKLQVRIAELETKNEILVQTNEELDTAKRDLEKDVRMLERDFKNEKDAVQKEIAEKLAATRHLELKLEDVERRELRAKELLTKSEEALQKVCDEYENTKCQLREKDCCTSAKIFESTSRIAQLNQELLSLRDDLSRLEENRVELNNTNEILRKTITNMNMAIEEYRVKLKESGEEKDIVRRNLGEMLGVVLTESESKCTDLNDETAKLKRVEKVVAELRLAEEKLKNDVAHVKKKLCIAQEENEKLQISLKAKSEDCVLFKKNNNKLKKYVQKLEMDVDQAEVKYSHMENKVRDLQMELEATKVEETQQQLQCKFLEKEKKSLESEAIWIEEKVERLSKKLENSFHLLRILSNDVVQDDSGVGDEECQGNLTSETGQPRGPLDSGIFSPDFEKSVVFPVNTHNVEMTSNEGVRALEAAVEKSLYVMSVLDKAVHDRTRVFSEKEEKLVEEVDSLKQSITHNQELRHVLEKQVERRDVSQKTLQETLNESNRQLVKCQSDMCHLQSVLDEKEKVVEMLQETVKDNNKRQEFWERKFDETMKEIDQQKNEKMGIERVSEDYQRKCDELKWSIVQNYASHEKEVKNLKFEIKELEDQAVKNKTRNSELGDELSTLRATTEELHIQLQNSGLRIRDLETQLKKSEARNSEARGKISILSQELEKWRTDAKNLEKTCFEEREAFNKAIQRQTLLNAEMERVDKKGKEIKVELVQLKFQNTLLQEEMEVKKKALQKKEDENLRLTKNVENKDEQLNNSDLKLKTIRGFLEQMNQCKDRLEKEIDQAKKENQGLTETNVLLCNENTNMSADMELKSLEIQETKHAIKELQSMNHELEKDLNVNSLALTKATDELNKAFVQTKKMKDLMESTQQLLNRLGSDSLQTHSNSSTDMSNNAVLGQEKVQSGLSYQLSAICTQMGTFYQKCQETIVEHRELLDEATRQKLLLNSANQEIARLENRTRELNETLTKLTEKYSNLDLLFNKQEQDLNDTREELLVKRNNTAELAILNSSLKEKAKHLESELSSSTKLAEDLREDRCALKEEILSLQNEVSSLRIKSARVDSLAKELEATKCSLNEIKNVHNKVMIAKDDLMLEMEYGRRKITKLENVNAEVRHALNETRNALEEERDRITTVTKLARMKERDLDNAKTVLKAKEEVISNLQIQIQVVKEQSGATNEELSDVKKQLMEVKENKEKLSNEKCRLWERYSILDEKLEQIQKEKKVLEDENMESEKKVSILAEGYDKQKRCNDKLAEEMALLKQEADQISLDYKEMESQKAKILEEMKDKDKQFQERILKLQEGCIASEAKNTDLQKSLDHLRSELGQSHNSIQQLKENNSKKNVELSELKVKFDSQEKQVKDLNDQNIEVTSEKKRLEELLDKSVMDIERLRSNLEETQEEMAALEIRMTEKGRELQVSTKKILSGREIIQTLRSAIAKSKKETKRLQDNLVEKDAIVEKANQELEQQRITIAELKLDKSNLEELYRMCQISDKALRNDLENLQSVLGNRSNEIEDLMGGQKRLEYKVDEKKTVIEELGKNKHEIRQQKDEIHAYFLDVQLVLCKLNTALHYCRTKIAAAMRKTCLMQTVCTTTIGGGVVDDVIHDGGGSRPLDSLSSAVEFGTEEEKASFEVKATEDELESVDSCLEQLHLSLNIFLDIQKKTQGNLDEALAESQSLCQKLNEQENNTKQISEGYSKLQKNYDHLETVMNGLEKSYHELNGERNLLERRTNELDKLLCHERQKSENLSGKVLSLNRERDNLNDGVQKLEEELRGTIRDKTELMSKLEKMETLQEEMVVVLGKLENLEEMYKNCCEDKTEVEEKLSQSEEQCVTLRKELDASMEISELLEKRFLEISDNNTVLRLKVEAQRKQIITLDDSLKNSTVQVEKLNKLIESLNNELRLATADAEEKGEEITQLHQEQSKREEELGGKMVEIQSCKNMIEDTLKSKKETEIKLQEKEVMLQDCEHRLVQEKKSGRDLKAEIGNIKQKHERIETKLAENVEQLMSQISVAKSREEAVRLELESTTETVGELEKEVAEQRTKMHEIEEKRKATVEELIGCKVSHIGMKGKLDQKMKDNKKLQNDKKRLKEQVEELDEKLKVESQKSFERIESQKLEIESLKIQCEDSERVIQNLRSDLEEMEQRYKSLEQECKGMKEESQAMLRDKEKSLQDVKLSCDNKDGVIAKVSNELGAEVREKEKLQEDLSVVNKKFGEAESKLTKFEVIHKEIEHEISVLHCKLHEFISYGNNDLSGENTYRDPSDLSMSTKLLGSSVDLVVDRTIKSEANFLELKEELAKSEKGYHDVTLENARLKQDLEVVREETRNLRIACESLKESLGKAEKSLQDRVSKNKLMETEIGERTEKEMKLEIKIEEMEDECLALHNEIGVIEKQRIALEKAMGNVGLERDNLINEILAKKEEIAILQDNNKELNKSNSILVGEISEIQERTKIAESSLARYVSENKKLQVRLTEAEEEVLVLGRTKQDVEEEKATTQERFDEKEKLTLALDAELNDSKRRCADVENKLSKVNDLNSEAIKENVELKQTKSRLTQEKERLEADISSLGRRIERMESDQNDKTVVNTHLQNQLDEAFTSLERQQSKFSQVLADKEVLQNQLSEAEKELKVLMEDNAVLNQQLYRNHKNVLSSQNTDELSKFRNQLLELKRKELALAQENRYLVQKLREKSEELRQSRLQEEESRRDMERNRENMKLYLEDRNRWEGEVKSVISHIGHGAKNLSESESEKVNNSYPEEFRSTRRKTWLF